MKKAFSTLVLSSALTLVSAQAIAETPYYVVPGAAYFIPDSDKDLDNEVLPAIGLGKNFNERWAAEIGIARAEVDSKTAGADDSDVTWLHLDGLYNFYRSERLASYVVAGVGTIDSDSGTQPFSGPQVNVGLGVKVPFTEKLGLRADYRVLNNFDGSDIDNIATLALSFGFGGNASKQPAPVVLQAKDGDNDGVIDTSDRCLSTPANTSVDAQGCALDSDKDGVTNNADKCPSTPAGEKVNLQGCPLDTDNDGIVDAKDQCPGTVAGAAVNTVGCILITENVRIKLNIEFANNSIVIDDKYLPEIEKVAAFMQRYQDKSTVVEGHTDSRGSLAYNKNISGRRANAVKQVLVSKFGIAASRISAVGFGPAQPIASNETSAGRQKNRRVVAEIKVNNVKPR